MSELCLDLLQAAFFLVKLVGKSASMHFVMHLFENVLVIHILVEKECKGRRGRYSHFGRQFDTASNKRSRQRDTQAGVFNQNARL